MPKGCNQKTFPINQINRPICCDKTINNNWYRRYFQPLFVNEIQNLLLPESLTNLILIKITQVLSPGKINIKYG